MAVTSIQNVTNSRSSDIEFINRENSVNNRQIAPNNNVSVSNCWIPWCNRASEFAAHCITIVDVNFDQNIWYIWQQREEIRVSSTGFENSQPIEGIAGTGGSYNLSVLNDRVSANRD